jgi:hypothetical protein
MNTRFAVSLALWSLVSACAADETKDKRTQKEEAGQEAVEEPQVAADEFDALALTQTQCQDAATFAKLTASVSGTLFINSPEVVNDARAKGEGKWSFAYLIREILELPAPGTAPALLAAEQAAVDGFIAKFNQSGNVNGLPPPRRNATSNTLKSSWGTRKGSDGKSYRTFADAPFKLVAIMNRMDIVKKGQDAVNAGEGRFIFGFTGGLPMTVIFEYDLPIGSLSNKSMASRAQWAKRWHNLKTFLTDTDAAKPGVQPDQRVGAALKFSNKADYLNALQGITELFANRTAQTRTGGTQAAISQIRTNEFISSPWELREIVRNRNSAGKANLVLTTVKNNPDTKFRSGTRGFSAWVNSNVECSVATDLNSCRYKTGNGQLPAVFASTVNQREPLLAASAPVSFEWFSGSTNVKQRFVALNTCSGCHQSETGTSFLHVSETGVASVFLKSELAKRLVNFKNQVCLAVGSTSDLNLTGESSIPPPLHQNFSVH